MSGFARGLRARGRVPVGGRITLHVPWPLASIDPHRLDDVTAAILGGALFDTLYAEGEGGVLVSSLADADPEPMGSGDLRVTLRDGLKTAAGRPLHARDVAVSISRARSLGASAWLSELPPPRVDGARTLIFAMKDANKLTRVLASPLVAVVPPGFSAERPDGTGPYRVGRAADALLLLRNPNAASGPSFLDEIVVRQAPDLATSLRAFEGGGDDVGWLGSGLHEPRPGAHTFDAGMIAWAVLRTGREAGDWGAPGVAQRLADGLPPGRLAYLALGAPWRQEADDGWGGAPCDLIVREDGAWLVELARAVAAGLTRPSHEVNARPVPPVEFAQRRASRAYALALDVVRPFAPGTQGALAALATADDAGAAVDAVKHPPRIVDVPARTLTRALRIGIVGEVRIQGGCAPGVTLPSAASSGVDFGAVTRALRAP